MSCSHSFPPVLLEWGNVVLDWPGVALRSTRLLESINMLDHSEFSIQNNHVNLCPDSDLTTLLIVFQSNVLPGIFSSVAGSSSISIQNKCYHGQYCAWNSTRRPTIFQKKQLEHVMMMMRGQSKTFYLPEHVSVHLKDMTVMKLLMSLYLNK